MKAIITKYLCPTNTRGIRISASDADKNKIIITMPQNLNVQEAHMFAAQQLCKKMGWKGCLQSGSLKNSYVHTFLDKATQTRVK